MFNGFNKGFSLGFIGKIFNRGFSTKLLSIENLPTEVVEPNTEETQKEEIDIIEGDNS